jgi:hypothetical protein
MELKYGPTTYFQINSKFSRKFEFCSIHNSSREKEQKGAGVEASLCF